jgi:Ca2+-binding EF-hand superfamily protein
LRVLIRLLAAPFLACLPQPRPLSDRLDKFLQLLFAAYDPDGDGVITTADIIRFHQNK